MTSITGRMLAGCGEAILHFLFSMEYMGITSFFKSDCWGQWGPGIRRAVHRSDCWCLEVARGCPLVRGRSLCSTLSHALSHSMTAFPGGWVSYPHFPDEETEASGV